jgi:hypothetical protein
MTYFLVLYLWIGTSVRVKEFPMPSEKSCWETVDLMRERKLMPRGSFTAFCLRGKE